MLDIGSETDGLTDVLFNFKSNLLEALTGHSLMFSELLNQKINKYINKLMAS